ncbi:hypothetical protein GCM10011357_11790 [Lacimicrobium alkaliphilum]|uniref:Uncharacterized protein n=1 Tax=Lacimicrobium alkaliphilum TaxID=1526571 RepID=A0ABQ1R863_9ALTE|nr:hypothetical protein GCM10011357_11790 [Lacimicrobium alkaliphilum]
MLNYELPRSPDVAKRNPGKPMGILPTRNPAAFEYITVAFCLREEAKVLDTSAVLLAGYATED